MQDLPPSKSTAPTSEDASLHKAGQCTAMCIYQTKIAGLSRSVSVLWSKNLINHSVSISIENPSCEQHYTCRVDLKPWPFWSKKGFKTLEVDGKRVDVFWDLRTAKFSTGSEPISDYYIAIVHDQEVVLLLGDCKKKAYKKTKSRPSLVDAILVSKRENVFGKRCFATRTKFDERKKEHEIVVENSISGGNECEMWISIDGLVVIHVTNLQWKFRGNDTVLVNQLPVQVFWDVHDWLFNATGLGHGLFIFKPGGQEGAGSDDDIHVAQNNRVDGESRNSGSGVQFPQFSLVLYAWKVE